MMLTSFPGVSNSLITGNAPSKCSVSKMVIFTRAKIEGSWEDERCEMRDEG